MSQFVSCVKPGVNYPKFDSKSKTYKLNKKVIKYIAKKSLKNIMYTYLNNIYLTKIIIYSYKMTNKYNDFDKNYYMLI